MYTTNTVPVKYCIYASNQAKFQLSERGCDILPEGECRAVQRGHTWPPCGQRSARWCLSPGRQLHYAAEPQHIPRDHWQSAKNNNTSYNVLFVTVGSLPRTTTPVTMYSLWPLAVCQEQQHQLPVVCMVVISITLWQMCSVYNITSDYQNKLYWPQLMVYEVIRMFVKWSSSTFKNINISIWPS